jgi:hypothetical protein
MRRRISAPLLEIASGGMASGSLNGKAIPEELISCHRLARPGLFHWR